MHNLVSKGVPPMFVDHLTVLHNLTRGSVGHSCPSAEQLQHSLPIDAAHQRRLTFNLFQHLLDHTLCHSLCFICIGEYPLPGWSSRLNICKAKVSWGERAAAMYMSTVVLSWRCSPLLSQSVGKDEGAALLLRLQRP